MNSIPGVPADLRQTGCCGFRDSPRMASSSRSTQRLSLAFFSDINQLRRCPAQASEAAITTGVLSLPGPSQRHRRCVRPQIPGLSPGGLGPPHVLRFPCGLSSGYPFARQVLPPSPAFLWFPFVRRSPVWSLRPLPGSRSRLRVPFPLSNVHASAAAGRVSRRWSRVAGTKVTSPAATTPLGSRDPPALQMGSGWARWDLATESPVTAAASAGHRRARTAQIGGSARGYLPINSRSWPLGRLWLFQHEQPTVSLCSGTRGVNVRI